MVGHFPEANAVRWLKLQRLSNGLLFVFVATESLPLGVNRVNWSAWKNSLVNYSAPIGRIFIPAAGILADDVENFDDLAYRKFASRERHFFEVLCETELRKITWVEEPLACDWFNDPAAREYRPFGERFSQDVLVSAVFLLLWVNLIAATLYYEDAYATKLVNLLAQSSSFWTLGHEK